jgi:AcrR family transcriptional regulator
MKQRKIPTLVKNDALVARRRRELVDAAVGLFIRQGFHKTTTREIAAAAGWSVGALYEYIQAKEDVLYLVCDAIHSDMEAALRERIAHASTGRETLAGAIAEYVRTCDRMQDAILLIYRETSALEPKSRRYVLQNEERITAIFTEILERGVADGTLRARGAKALELMAHNITVLGHMWAFRRWFLAGHFALEEYIAQQTALILNDTAADSGG